MRKLLLITTLLSITVSENILMENPLKTIWTICDKQQWNRKIKRPISEKNIFSKIKKPLNYEGDTLFPRISDTRFISEIGKSPSIIIRRHGSTQSSLDDSFFDKSKIDRIEPKVLIFIGIQEKKKIDNNLQDLKRNNCNQDWQFQKPFYVEEPTWVDIDIDYIDSSQVIDNSDPYILTRGKKIHKNKNEKQVDKIVEDYEETLDYPRKSQISLIKSRMRRSIKTNEKPHHETIDMKNNRMKKKNYYNFFQNENINNTMIIKTRNKDENSSKIDKILKKPNNTNYDILNKQYKKDNLNNAVLHKTRFTKQNKVSQNDITTEKNKKTMLLKNRKHFETRKKREIYENNVNSKKDENKNKLYGQMKTKADSNKLNEPDIFDNFFIFFRDKVLFSNKIKNLNKRNMNFNPYSSNEEKWKLRHAHHNKLEKSNKEIKNREGKYQINKYNVGMTDSQLTKSNAKHSEIKTLNHREKRNVCKVCKIKSQFQQDEWLKDIEKKIQESLSLERRNKQTDILERLSEPYFISRGKKTLLEKDLQNMYNENHVNIMNLPVVKNLLRMLPMKLSRCDNSNCNVNTNQLSNERLLPRDRRSTFEEIFAVYDPYYVARGKRSKNQKNILFEVDTTQ